ncbi:ribosome-associated translation inhibitor RaiA [Alicyclobacillus tolerans]|uniref:ribosome hibernation-promoting factor, HPF/YfiA family n=1 Tax=Alicyclobacillus tolerans TaxID=90970 RepID=UPI001EFF9746|nr:ribosome-associated translation inhibitor RaiA [Alicyclobacillus tolerans]MCF8568451.1 ribosome-associated translation inhibitor RaiA [Alicyclobacillus tolerans]
MNIQVRGDHVAVTPALREYAEKKIGRLQKYFDAPPEKDISITMSVERGLHRVEVTMQVHGVLFRAEEKSNDMYASLDLVTDKLEHQMNRYKAKINQKFKAGGVRTRVKTLNDRGVFSAISELAAVTEVEEDIEANIESSIVRTKRVPMKPMHIEEAVMQMDLLGHDFFVFTNAESEEINVVYRRRNGNYGLIEPSI